MRSQIDDDDIDDMPEFGTVLDQAGANKRVNQIYKGFEPTPVGTKDDDHKRFNIKLECWTGNGSLFAGASKTMPRLEPGVYSPMLTPNGPIVRKHKISVDHLIDAGDKAASELVGEFVQFWQLKDKFKAHGFLHKRGFLLWGPPGSGKTSLLHVMMRELIEKHGGIVVLIDHPHTAIEGLHLIREIEPDRQIICIMEDIDAMVQRWGEDALLSLLDGEAQVDNVSFVATTNYPENLDARFANRPSRFDTIKYIGMPSAKAREAFFKAKALDLTDAEREVWVSRTDGFSMAHLKEIIVAVECLGQPFDDVLKRLHSMRVKIKSSDAEAGFRTGFVGKSLH